MQPATPRQGPSLSLVASEPASALRPTSPFVQPSVDALDTPFLAEHKAHELALWNQAIKAGRGPSVIVLERMTNEIEGNPAKTALRIWSLETTVARLLDRMDRQEQRLDDLLGREEIR